MAAIRENFGRIKIFFKYYVPSEEITVDEQRYGYCGDAKEVVYEI